MGLSVGLTSRDPTISYSRDAPSWCFRFGERGLSIEKQRCAGTRFSAVCRRKEDILPDNRLFIIATYADLAQADGDYATIRRLHGQFGAPVELDAVIIGRKASGEARFYSTHRDGRRPDPDERTAWSLAAGLAAALLPSVYADAPRSLVVQRAVLGAVAGEVGRSIGRGDLMALGSHVDESPATLIVVAKAERESRIREALCHTSNVLVRSAVVDLDLIRRAANRIVAIRC